MSNTSLVLAGVSPLGLLSGLGMILVAVGYVVWAARRRLGWGYLGLGAVGWIIAIAIKSVLAGLASMPIYTALTGALRQPLANWAMSVYVGALTGVTEVLIIWLVLRYTRLGRAGWARALAFGIGFGAVEALLLGISSLMSVAAAMLAPDMVPPDASQQFSQLGDVRFVIAPIWERLFVVLIHIAANVLIFYGVVKHQARWLWVSFLYMTVLDTVAAYANFWGLTTLAHIWVVEAIIAVLGAIGCLGLRWLSPHYPHVERSPMLERADVEASAEGS